MKLADLLRDVFGIAGAGLIALGAGMIVPAAGVIVGGVLLLGGAWLSARAK